MRFALLGAGRVGGMHAELITESRVANLYAVCDPNLAAAQAVAERFGARATRDPVELSEDPLLEAVVVCTPPNTHAELIGLFAGAGKAVLCEKPADVDIDRVDACLSRLGDAARRVQIGFNRRYHPDIVAMKEALRAGVVGEVSMLSITSRDAIPTVVENIPGSGGLFRNTTIHDFDLARFLLDSEPVALQAFAAVHVNPAYADLGDVDTAIIAMRMSSGTLVQINNSRRAAYGYDQRVEVFGGEGMLQTSNPCTSGLLRYTGEVTMAAAPYEPTYRGRYLDSFRSQLADFIAAISARERTRVSFEDGREALRMADAALLSSRTGAPVRF